MKILLANKFYYRRGGDCSYMLNLEQLLQSHGHEVAIFAMDYPENMDSPWNRYFPKEVKFAAGIGIIEALRRPLGSKCVINKFEALLTDFEPDVVHMNNIHSQLSPVIAELAHKKGIKVVWTLHDYKLLCPRYDCLRNGKTICEACFLQKREVLSHKCMKKSRLASFLAYVEAKKWTRERLEKCTNAFICPSNFMACKMVQGGYDKSKMNILCNFIDTDKCQKEDYNKDEYYCYIGRLSHEKGVETLISAAKQLPYKLKIIGDGPLMESIKKRVENTHIELLGYKSWSEIKKILGQARFSVIPSEWYENNPFSVIESQSLGTPVLGARIGGIPELIDDDKNGMLFEARNTADLRDKIEQMYQKHFDYQKIANNSLNKYSADSYYDKLMSIYNE